MEYYQSSKKFSQSSKWRTPITREGKYFRYDNKPFLLLPQNCTKLWSTYGLWAFSLKMQSSFEILQEVVLLWIAVDLMAACFYSSRLQCRQRSSSKPLHADFTATLRAFLGSGVCPYHRIKSAVFGTCVSKNEDRLSCILGYFCERIK